MATSDGVLAPLSVSPSLYSGGASNSHSAIEVHNPSHSSSAVEVRKPSHSAPAVEVRNAPTHFGQISASGDVVFISRASTLLSGVEQQLKQTPASAIHQVLNSAATDILAQAQLEGDPNQARVLENLATRLQVAANSGPSGLPPFSLSSLLAG